jgi:tripartite-type tricarboxylate transporter receptor subunit TctC
MTAELFQYTAGIHLVHVAYRGEAPAINDLLAGQIPLMFANLSAVMGNLKAGTLRALAVTGAQRSPSAPEIPTVAESALPGFDAETWFGIVAPPGTPRAIRDKLNAAALKALASDDTKKRYLDLGMVPRSSTPDQFDTYIKAEVAKWANVIKEANVQALD